MSERTRAQAIRRMQAAASGEPEPEFALYQRFLKCRELHEPSAILARACAALGASEYRHTAFTARTHTPIVAPPGWLPPPI